MSRSANLTVLALAIAILTAIVFGQVVTHRFLTYDDGQFVTQNPHVRAGLTASSIRWAWTSAGIGYYPLTWLSHMADVEMFGLNAGGHLATALLLHIASSVLLFLALARMTGAPLRSAFVAALFAIHPMHVESVAWVAERKDTLSTLFGMIALFLYARPRTVGRDVLIAIAFAASLLAKQMLVTLPFVFLLLDWWPLRRKPAVVEKIPLFILSAAGVVLAIAGQRNLNALQSTAALPLGTRIVNALVAYARYIGKLVWPSHLAPLYPLTAETTAAAAAALLLIIAVTAIAWGLRDRFPYLLTGWFWFLGTLVPVIGLVQIGATGMADRYSYFPSIGLFIAIVWLVADVVPAKAAAIAGLVVVAILSILCFVQTSRWRDTETLFSWTLEVTGPNPVAEYSLGQALETTDPDRAIDHLRRAIDLTDAALRANPDAARPSIYAQSYVGIGTALLTKARATTDADAQAKLVDDAGAAYQTALNIDPTASVARRNLALVASMRAAAGREKQTAMDRFIDQGVALSQQHRFDDAIAEYRKAVAAVPTALEAHIYLGIGLAQARQNAEAAKELRIAQKIDPARANRFVTGILRLPPGSDNLDRVLGQLDASR